MMKFRCFLVMLAVAGAMHAEKKLQIFKNGEIIDEFPVSEVEYVEVADVADSTPFDLSQKEMANCYIVQKNGVYKFKADNQFNLGQGLPVPPEIHPADARLVWQTVPGSIKSVEFVAANQSNADATTGPAPGYIEFEVAEAKGNAVIAALDADGAIVWSWHIWMPEADVTSVATSTGYELMTLNLGALNNTPGDPASYGMLYQWGRKDPFPAAGTLTGNTTTVSATMYDIDGKEVKLSNSSWYNTDSNNIAYAVANPTVVLSNYSQTSISRDWLAAGQQDDALWGNPNGADKDSNNEYPNKGRKTCYDPSPAGWRVAPADAFRDYTTTGGYAWDISDFNVADSNNDGTVDIDDYNYGWHFNANTDTPLYFPAAARFDGSYAMLMGSVSGLWGSYWTNAPYPTISGGAFCGLSFQVKDQVGNDMITVSPSGGASRADAYSIRCVRDK